MLWLVLLKMREALMAFANLRAYNLLAYCLSNLSDAQPYPVFGLT